MNWKKEVFQNFKLYAVTDLLTDSDDILDKIEQAYLGGADIVQLRSKNLSDSSLLRLGFKIRQIANFHKKLFFVNDRPDIALLLDADGVHLGQDDLPVSAVRRLAADMNKMLWVGKSTHNLLQGLSAMEEAPDYLGVGPVFKTPTKSGYQPAGLEYVQQAVTHLSLPWVAIGGIDLDNLEHVLEAGARRIAVVRAIFSARNVEEAAAELKDKMEKFLYAKN